MNERTPELLLEAYNQANESIEQTKETKTKATPEQHLRIKKELTRLDIEDDSFFQKLKENSREKIKLINKLIRAIDDEKRRTAANQKATLFVDKVILEASSPQGKRRQRPLSPDNSAGEPPAGRRPKNETDNAARADQSATTPPTSDPRDSQEIASSWVKEEKSFSTKQVKRASPTLKQNVWPGFK